MSEKEENSKIAEYARKLELEGKYEEALTYHEMDIEQKTAPYDVRKDMGRILNKMGNFEEAIKSFDLVLAMNNNHPECWFGKGISYLGLFDWVEAYKSFSNASKLNENDANSWYYMAIIYKDFGFDDQSKIKFRKFLEYDTNDYKVERQCYEFGLIVEQRKNELFENKKKINIIDFKIELKSLNVDSHDINYYLHCLPYNKLIEKILSLRKINYNNNVKEIIRHELKGMNLDNNTINKMFEVESLDSLRDKIISSIEYNPFPSLEKELNIPYYVVTLKDYVERHIKRGYIKLPTVSKFNILTEISIPNYINKTNFNLNRNFFRSNSISIHENKNKAKKYFRYGKYLISEKNEDGIQFLKDALDLYPKEDVMKFNIKFYLATVLSKFGFYDEAFHYYMQLRNSRLDLENFDIFSLNFANLCYDLGYYFDAIDYYDRYLRINPDCEVVRILKNSAKKLI